MHPAKPEEATALARALRHLGARDPGGAHEVRQRVRDASRELKSALKRLEALLDGHSAEDDEFDPFAGMAPSEVRRGNSPANGNAPASGNGNAHPNGHNGQMPPFPSVLSSPEAPLSPGRQTAARKSVGRTLRSELTFERERFRQVAKAHELPLGRKHEKEMLAAIGSYLGVPVTARRDLSSHQWARCASAIETEDLAWGKPQGAQPQGVQPPKAGTPRMESRAA